MALVNVFKVTIVFEGRTRGWTESFWYQGTSTDHRALIAPTRKLCRMRGNLLAQPCFIKAYRISLEGSGPDALLAYEQFLPAQVQLAPGQAASLGKSNDPDSSLLVRISIQNFSRWKFVFLRGHPDYIFSNNGEYTPDVAWNNLFLSWAKTLAGDNWGWLGVDPTQKVSKVGITNIEVSPTSGTSTFTFKANVFPPLLPTGTPVRIRISGVNGGRSPANKTWVVYPTSQQTATTVNAAATGIYRSGGVVSYTPLFFLPVYNVEDQKYAERKCGAPLLESRGRQAKQARG